MLGSGVAAGAFGSLLGLGGGILIVPILTLGFGLPLREAAGVSLISVIVTSSAAAGVYLERHVANLRLDRVPARRAGAVAAVRRAPAVRGSHDGSVPRRAGAGDAADGGGRRPCRPTGRGPPAEPPGPAGRHRLSRPQPAAGHRRVDGG